ncbi:nicotinate-nicotinamide nucleotide adenylyltransferase [Reinekea sp.]|uniref:nicotinate-nicotinamide nucleotide adenylyltransferase n=3 Tax=Reinekea sp. TaxID=1970455 RepID=UPI00398963A1
MNPSSAECLYGGTFDPFHNGHEAICHHILAKTKSRESVLRIIPCSQPALKQQAQASNLDRLAMLEKWRDTQPAASRILIDDIEMISDRISYTAETIIELKKQDVVPVKRIWVLGTDAFNSLSQWHQVSTLVSTLNFWVINRAGEKELNNKLGLTKLASHSQLWSAASGSFWFDQTIDMPVASSAIRQNINRQPVPVPKVIADYIEKHELYMA